MGTALAHATDMRKFEVTLPLLGLVAATRGMLGAGIGLLVAERLSHDRRRTVGWTLVAVGIATTLPLLSEVAGRAKLHRSGD
jgi:hypothetical protein